ncbi:MULTISPECIES: hypothetical protein [Lysinibacillus]|uniref:hypothetical protein n=1 Tax=Lysinibacillus TaxID=400634 RepID=UPI00257EC857|nr:MULTISPECIES: hypothetical protein [Lysinibacillus]
MSNQDLQMESWLTVNDVSLHQNIQTPLSFDLTSSLLDAAPVQDTISGGLIIGNTQNEAIDANNNVKNALQTYGRFSNEVKESAQVSPIVGLTTILDIARIVSNYNPALPTDQENDETKKARVIAYNQYITKVLQNPLMHLKSNYEKKYTKRTSSWKTAIDEISNLYDGITEKDKEKIKNSLQALAEAASSRSNKANTENIFAQNIIVCKDEEIEFCIYSSSVTMLYSGGKNTVRQVDFTLNETHIRFTKELWSRYSDKVLDKHLALIDDWLLGISTPNSDKTTLACFV